MEEAEVVWSGVVVDGFREWRLIMSVRLEVKELVTGNSCAEEPWQRLRCGKEVDGNRGVKEFVIGRRMNY